MVSTAQSREFGGPVGNLVLIAGLPAFTAYLFFAVRFNDGAIWPRADADVVGFWDALQPTAPAAAVYLGWLVLQVLLQHFAPGRTVLGTSLPDGRRLPYRLNGWWAFVVTMTGASLLHASGWLSIRVLHDEFGAILTISTLFSFAFSVFLYLYGRRYDSAGLQTGGLIHDFWMGTGLNPRVPPTTTGFDLKLFCEARPGLLLWVLINGAFAFVQYETYGFVSLSMVLVLAFQLLYVADYFWNEEAILTTMDVKHERFGYMLAFGDLVWVPMTYTLQAHYLIHNVHDLSPWVGALIVGLNILGFYIFRAVNLQKHRFRRDPKHALIWGKKAEYIETTAGGYLLVSGFWGWSRHFNYVGDLLMALSWSLPCLFGSPLPYFYPFYFLALLIHRERRDHHICSRKYGDDWKRYCERVPYRIFPGVY